MTRAIRYLPSGGGLVEVTCRTLHSRFLLRPSAAVNDLVIGVLGRALEHFPVEVVGLVCMSNHLHALLWVENVQVLSGFMQHLNSNLARELGKLHGWPHKFWSRRYTMIRVSDEPAAQIGRLKYLLAQGAKEGIVADPRDWPGIHCAEALAEGETLRGTWYDRSQQYRLQQRGRHVDSAEFATTYEVSFAKLPCWQHLSDEAYRARIAELLEQIHEEAVRFRQENRIVLRARRKVRRALQRVHPHSAPAVSVSSPCPAVHAASKRVRKRMCDAYAVFILAYREAADALRRGERNVSFPEGCFPSRSPFVVAGGARSP